MLEVVLAGDWRGWLTAFQVRGGEKLVLVGDDTLLLLEMLSCCAVVV